MSSSNAHTATNIQSTYFTGWDTTRCQQLLAKARDELNNLPPHFSNQQREKMTCAINTRIRAIQTILALHTLSDIMEEQDFARLAKEMNLTQLPKIMEDFMRRAETWERHIRQHRTTSQQRQLCEALAHKLFFTRLLKRIFKHDADTWLEALQQKHPDVGWLKKVKPPKSKLAEAV